VDACPDVELGGTAGQRTPRRGRAGPARGLGCGRRRPDPAARITAVQRKRDRHDPLHPAPSASLTRRVAPAARHGLTVLRAAFSDCTWIWSSRATKWSGASPARHPHRGRGWGCRRPAGASTGRRGRHPAHQGRPLRRLLGNWRTPPGACSSSASASTARRARHRPPGIPQQLQPAEHRVNRVWLTDRGR